MRAPAIRSPDERHLPARILISPCYRPAQLPEEIPSLSRHLKYPPYSIQTYVWLFCVFSFFQSEGLMRREFDVFERFSDGSTLWRATVVGKFEALRKMQELREYSDNEFVTLDVHAWEASA